MDLIASTERMPRPGETVFATSLTRVAGGKGLNQAIAARRLGLAPVYMLGSIGNDPFGSELLEFMRAEDIETVGITSSPDPTGVALITVDSHAENTIVVATGANSRFAPSTLDPLSSHIANAGVALVQLEIPVETVHRFLTIASEFGVATILNTAPALPLPDTLLSLVDILCLNETELSEMTQTPIDSTDRETLVSAAGMLLARGPRSVIVTLGAAGALTITPDDGYLTPAPAVHALDPTGAGDCFLGALASRLNEGASLPDAITFANKAAALSVQRPGASSSIPHRPELESL